MANTFSTIHIQIVFAVKYRRYVIAKAWKNELFKYINGVVQNQGHKLLCINGVEDHIHLLLGVRPAQSLSELVQIIKKSSTAWINNRKLTPRAFAWQEGFGAFSYSKDDLPAVKKYIDNQEAHHSKLSFNHEFRNILTEFEIDFDERYIFHDLE